MPRQKSLQVNQLGVASKKKQFICWHYPNLGWPPSLLPYFWQIIFWQCVDDVDLPPSPQIFDKTMQFQGFNWHNLLSNYTSTFCFRQFELRKAVKKGITLLYNHKFWGKIHPKLHLWPTPSPLFVKNFFCDLFLTWGWPPPLLYG